MLNQSSIALCLLYLAMNAPVAADDNLRAVQREYSQTILPLLQNYCSDCHTGDSANAGFNLDNYQSLDQLLLARKNWQKVEFRVAAKEMPPDDADPLPDDDHQVVMNWLDQLLHSVDCTEINPGRVTLRRLNRTEYRNTIREDKSAQRILARKILNRFAFKAFRRRATSDELDRLFEFFETARAEGDKLEVAMRFPLQAILVSPHFLYKIVDSRQHPHAYL